MYSPCTGDEGLKELLWARLGPSLCTCQSCPGWNKGLRTGSYQQFMVSSKRQQMVALQLPKEMAKAFRGTAIRKAIYLSSLSLQGDNDPAIMAGQHKFGKLRGKLFRWLILLPVTPFRARHSENRPKGLEEWEPRAPSPSNKKKKKRIQFVSQTLIQADEECPMDFSVSIQQDVLVSNLRAVTLLTYRRVDTRKLTLLYVGNRKHYTV